MKQKSSDIQTMDNQSCNLFFPHHLLYLSLPDALYDRNKIFIKIYQRVYSNILPMAIREHPMTTKQLNSTLSQVYISIPVMSHINNS